LRIILIKKIAREPGWKRRTPSSPVPGTDRELMWATEAPTELQQYYIPFWQGLASGDSTHFWYFFI
jgi:hypothetical protein